MATYKDEEERRANIIIFNLPESNNELKAEAQQEDQDKFFDITKICEVPFSPKDVVDTFRLGKKYDTAEKSRPVLVKLAEEEKKKQLFKKLDLFRKHQNDEKTPGDESPGIQVAHDMSQEQRKEKKVLFEEAKAKDLQLESESPYRHIVRGPPWEMKIVKVKRK